MCAGGTILVGNAEAASVVPSSPRGTFASCPVAMVRTPFIRLRGRDARVLPRQRGPRASGASTGPALRPYAPRHLLRGRAPLRDSVPSSPAPHPRRHARAAAAAGSAAGGIRAVDGRHRPLGHRIRARAAPRRAPSPRGSVRGADPRPRGSPSPRPLFPIRADGLSPHTGRRGWTTGFASGRSANRGAPKRFSTALRHLSRYHGIRGSGGTRSRGCAYLPPIFPGRADGLSPHTGRRGRTTGFACRPSANRGAPNALCLGKPAPVTLSCDTRGRWYAFQRLCVAADSLAGTVSAPAAGCALRAHTAPGALRSTRFAIALKPRPKQVGIPPPPAPHVHLIP